MSECTTDQLTYADPSDVERPPTSFHVLAGVTEGPEAAEITRLIITLTAEMKSVQKDLRDISAMGLANPHVIGL